MNDEIRMTNVEKRHSSFELRVSFGLLISDFGLRVSAMLNNYERSFFISHSLFVILIPQRRSDQARAFEPGMIQGHQLSFAGYPF